MIAPASQPIVSPAMDLEEFHELTSGVYRFLPEAEVRAMIAALEVVADCAVATAIGQRSVKVT